ncbi:MAG: TIGR02449 family protein [Gammaproteobacteria bacterium]|jgi:cell division protein ZapB|nr:TIGR02449 family protein [Pseudomonadota bacterium]MDG2302880.1 TIGR02449 family protein [Gammaproteobacteria bacterium]MBT5064690.1 TIGR02449 family protein [Pseudomonadota bacterium]MBT6192855.1 TIGR02449 family protein [Pseudomonadota bacterium]MBT6465077.1 TIGR02449 family protein [Pseudomonadota bacterium]
MDKNDTNELELSSLEARIDELITTIESLTVENTVLKTHQNTLTLERTELISKTEQARTRVEGMITRLKALENRS